jgi:PAS domain S-box-containing protein
MLIPPYNTNEISLILAWIKNGERIDHYETLRRRKDGTLVDISLSSSPVRDHEGRVVSVSTIARDITNHKKMELEIQESEEKFREVFNNANDAIFLNPLKVGGKPGKFIEVNDVACQRLGYSREELLEMGLEDIASKEDLHLTESIKLITSEGTATFESIQLAKDCTPIPVEISSHLFFHRGERMILSIARDITRRKENEAKLRKSLEEKELLLKEIHHRVKNNLNVISSLLSLQSKYIKDKAALEVFKESQRRARSMALIHKMLYQSIDLKCINFGEYIQTLTEELFGTYATGDNIELNLEVGDILLDINTAVPLGLIVNELVSNSLKHAFPDNREGEIIVEFNKNNQYHFSVADTGVGFPEDFDYRKANSLGMRLVNTLVDQINATMEVHQENGSCFKIKFSEEKFTDMSL